MDISPPDRALADLPVPNAQEELPAPLPGIPFPVWMVAFTLVTALAFFFGLARIGHAFGAGIAFERAERQIKAGNPEGALTEIQKASVEYPASLEVKIDLAEAYVGTGDLPEASKVLSSLEGAEVSDEQKKRLDQIASSFESAAKELEKEGAASK